MEQFEQLLTCAICLDRYRNPKLLPCQHSFCMEPCMDGLVDYVRRQVKCPECRAEHRIPYNGVQGYPTNVTLQRFLELHIEITGELPDPTSGQVMKRCGVCSEKAYVTPCVHCDKEVCADCKGAHMDILRREISRINNQVRRAVHRLSDMLTGVEKNMLTLQLNCTSVSEEVDEIYGRLAKALKDRTEHIRGEIDRYLTTELKNLSNLKDNLEIEISNIQSNCDLADKYMQSDDVEWEDSELMDAKEIFLKTVEFIRNFETEIGDYNRRAKFIMAHDPNQLVMHVAGYGDLVIQAPHQPFSSSSNTLQPPGPGLMRSKSDHRLASQYRQEERNAYGDGGSEISGRVSPLGGRKFGERYPSRYSRGDRNEYDVDSSHDNENRSSARSRIRSRLNRHGLGDNTDSDTDTRSVRFSEPSTAHRERERVLDTEDVAKGPLSGITRLYDSPRVMKRLQENENKEKKEVIPKTVVQVQQQVHQFKKASPQHTPQRQLSEDDEIARIKRQNKTASTSSDTDRKDRVSIIKREDSQSSNRSNTPTDNSRKSAVAENADPVETSESESEEEVVVETRKSTPVSKPPTSSSSTGSRRSSMTSGNNQRMKSTRSESMDSSGSSETPGTTARKIAGASYPSDEVKHSPVGSRSGSATPRARFSSISSKRDSSTPTNSRSQSYNASGNNEGASRKEEIEDEEEEDEDTDTSSESSETESDEDSEDAKPKTPTTKAMEKTDIGPLLARSANARDNNSSGNNSRRPSQDESYTRSRYGPGGYKSSSSYQSPKEPESAASGSKYLNRTAPRFTSRFLKNKSIEEDPSKSSYSSESKYNDKGLLRSRTSANLDEDLNHDDPGISPYSSSYSKNHYGSDLSRSRSSHALKSRETSPDRPVSGAAEKDGASLSSWARYLKNKYGNRNKENAAKDNMSSSSSAVAAASAPSSSSSSSRRVSLGLGSRSNSNVVDSSDDDQKNMQSSPTSRTTIEPGMQGVGSTPRVQYLQKRQLLFKIGGRGSEPGYFTWPRGVAVGPENQIVVADSSNHRVQVFDSRGSLYKEFGSYGNGEGEFDCLAGLAVNRIGQYIIADRYNHRIQVLDPAGRFLRSFGSQGSSDGRFNYPWGITTDALGFIYVCDKENHRIQVFQSDGTFVGKFGSQGNKIGQLEHPHYIAVSNTNRVIVSDCNNHRIQIFDVNGRVISSFGTEGSENGQFKFPKGVAVDDQGYILVADSGNNRVQIFHPDSTFLRAFGCWGSGDGEFKGLEGVAVMSNGNILVCDRENHRVQVF